MSTTLAQLREKVRQRADQEHSDFVTDAELDAYINNSYTELYDIIVSKHEDYFVEEYVANADSEGHVVVPPDFYKLVGVDFYNNGDYFALKKWMFADRNKVQRTNLVLAYGYTILKYRLINNTVRMLPKDAAQDKQFKLWYVPSVAPITESNPLPAYNGWDEYIIIDAAIKCFPVTIRESISRHINDSFLHCLFLY